MAYTEQHMVLQWGGSFRSGSPTAPFIEEFSGTMRFAGPGLDQANKIENARAIAIALGRYWSKPEAMIPKSAYLEFIKWNRVDVNGRYVAEDSSRTVHFPGILGGGQIDRYPLQVTWVTTWGTDAVRGKACRGRTFWPTAVPLGIAFNVGDEYATAKAAADNALLTDLRNAARSGYVTQGANNGIPSWASDLGFAPGPLSEGSGMSPSVMSKIGSGTTRIITHSEVGTRLDTQRRRALGQTDRRVQVVA